MSIDVGPPLSGKNAFRASRSSPDAAGTVETLVGTHMDGAGVLRCSSSDKTKASGAGGQPHGDICSCAPGLRREPVGAFKSSSNSSKNVEQIVIRAWNHLTPSGSRVRCFSDSRDPETVPCGPNLHWDALACPPVMASGVVGARPPLRP